VNLRSILIPLALAVPGMAQTPAGAAPSKVAIIQFQAAVLATQEGQAAQAALKTKYDPRKAQLEKRQADLQAIQDKLQKGGATLAADVRSKLEADLASGSRSLKNDAEDMNSDAEQDQNKLLQAMANRLGEIVKDYSTKNGFSVVLDVGSQQSAVLWAAPTVNITEAIVKLYDEKHPLKTGEAAKPAAPPAASPAAPKPPASKKQ
jgi:outer membrane protein